MSITKIPDSILEKLRCQCSRYLSKPPINLRDGQIFCNDCTEIHAPELTVTRSAPYEALASLFTFPCRYKSQGCEEYIEFTKMEDHESVCAYRSYMCPASMHLTCNWTGAISQFYQHYTEEHPDLCLETPRIKIHVDEDYEMYNLVNVQNVLLLLKIKCILEQNKLWFNAVYLGAESDAKLITYSIQLKGVNRMKPVVILDDVNTLPITKIQMMTEESLSFNVSTLTDILKHPGFIDCQWMVNLSNEFKNKIKTQQENEEENQVQQKKESITCPNCGIYMVPPIFKCDKDHVTCVDCKGYYGECKLCKRRNVDFAAASDLEEIAESIPHTCRWVDCRRELPCSESREHERSCASRVYQCPECNVSGIYDEMVDHFAAAGILNHTKFRHNLVDMVIPHSDSYYAFVDHEFLKVDIDLAADTYYLDITVWYLGSVSFSDCWNYEIRLNDELIRLHKIAHNRFYKSSVYCKYKRYSLYSIKVN